MNSKSNSLVKKIVSQLDDQTKGELLLFAKEVHPIVTSKGMSRVDKIRALKKVKTTKPVLQVIKNICNKIKVKTWDERGWFARLGLGGLVVGATVFGSKAAGVASFGAGTSVLLSTLTGIGGSLIGGIIDELEKEPPKD